jgi:hypothetical protein
MGLFEGPWKLEGMVLGQQSVWVKDLAEKDRPFIIERPKVLYNSATKKFVMWFHLDAAEAVAAGTRGWRRRLAAAVKNANATAAFTAKGAGRLGAGRPRRLDDGNDPRGPKLGSGSSSSSSSSSRRSGGKHPFRYFFRRAGVAMAASPAGPFRFVHALQPDGLPSLDLQLFQEPDPARGAFLIRSVDNK